MTVLNTPFKDDAKEIIETTKKYNLFTWMKQSEANPIPVKDASGCWYTDYTGQKWFDLGSGLICINIGYGQQKVVDAMAEQASALPYIKTQETTAVRAALSKKLIEEIAPKGMFGKVLYTLAGADANEYAIKLAKKLTGRIKIFSQYYSYHGSTYAASNLCGDPQRTAADPKIPGFVKFFGPSWSGCKAKFETEEEYTDFLLDMLEQQLICEGPETVAAIFLESIPGSSVAVQIPPIGYYEKLRKICDKYGILLVIDEVMAGFGRSGKMFSFEHYDYTPDLVTFAKGVTSSYSPLGGVLVRKELCDKFEDIPLGGGLTYNSHPVSLAAALANMEIYQEQHLVENSAKMGEIMYKGLIELKEKHPSVERITGKWGLYHGMFFVDKLCTEENGNKIMNVLREKHMTTLGKMGHFMVAPALVITEEEVEYVLKTLDECCDIYDSWL